MTCREPRGCVFPDGCAECGCRSFRDDESVPDVAGRDIPHAESCRGVHGHTSSGETILEEAHRLIYGDRQAEYGPGHVEMEQVAAVWSVIVGAPVSAYQAALCMAGLKLVRARNAYKRDSLVDGAGYLGLAQRVIEGR